MQISGYRIRFLEQITGNRSVIIDYRLVIEIFLGCTL